MSFLEGRHMVDGAVLLINHPKEHKRPKIVKGSLHISDKSAYRIYDGKTL